MLATYNSSLRNQLKTYTIACVNAKNNACALAILDALSLAETPPAVDGAEARAPNGASPTETAYAIRRIYHNSQLSKKIDEHDDGMAETGRKSIHTRELATREIGSNEARDKNEPKKLTAAYKCD